MKSLSFFSICLLIAANVFSQSLLPTPENIEHAISKGTRSISGMPGKNYWQNNADYNIKINFEPTTRLLTGTEEIIYTNNSPDTLKQIVFKLYPNLYKKGSQRLMTIKAEDISEGVAIEEMKVDNITQELSGLKEDGTNMIVKIAPLLPGRQLNFFIKFSYTLNKTSHIRTGEVDEGSYFIAYFFPRIAVYDDIDGWNLNPYLGTQEFYNDFCHFNTSVTVPANYLVWATGDLKNCDEVLNEAFCKKIKQAENSDAIINIIDSTDLKNGNITLPNNTNTWKFEANNVTDVAIGISNHYIWQSSSLVVDKATGRRTRVDAVFNPSHKDYFRIAMDARKTVEAMSYRFPKWPYPYNHETVFDGLDQMEYPMMVNDNPLEDKAESIELTDHEIFHTMFPFYMGINETKYGWMDEGWATIGEWLISPMIDSTIVDEYGMDRTEKFAGTEVDMPITTLTTQEYGLSMFLNSYPKPALGYLYVKDMLGDDLFFKGLHHYFKNWAGKHPIPTDFFYSMNAGSGKNLNWFWQKWFYQNGLPDEGIVKLTGSGSNKLLMVKLKGTKPLPVDVTIIYKDGSTQKIHRSIAVWENGNNTTAIRFTATKLIKKILLGSTYIPDADRSDNELEIK
ncbi:MAG: M1 family metallopeptidase [Bacteroidetes bacterium]|nr:M1 family metallopeptidase [Bacteroidota bacterium]MBS1755809.1 M1 family metallopeptidase [Bacteroidota bacterium]